MTFTDTEKNNWLGCRFQRISANSNEHYIIQAVLEFVLLKTIKIPWMLLNQYPTIYEEYNMIHIAVK